MVESTKQVSENYLSTEKGYADDWAAYIASCHMKMCIRDRFILSLLFLKKKRSC